MKKGILSTFLFTVFKHISACPLVKCCPLEVFVSNSVEGNYKKYL